MTAYRCTCQINGMGSYKAHQSCIKTSVADWALQIGHNLLFVRMCEKADVHNSNQGVTDTVKNITECHPKVRDITQEATTKFRNNTLEMSWRSWQTGLIFFTFQHHLSADIVTLFQLSDFLCVDNSKDSAATQVLNLTLHSKPWVLLQCLWFLQFH